MVVYSLRERVLARQKLFRQLPPPDVCRRWRRAAGATLAEVAAEVGVTRSAVGLWERGKRRPTGEHLRRYLEVLEALHEAA